MTHQNQMSETDKLGWQVLLFIAVPLVLGLFWYMASNTKSCEDLVRERNGSAAEYLLTVKEICK